MENASKALLIAGSILIVILLIAVGVKVFNSTTGTKDSVEDTIVSTEATTFNNKFIPYIGKLGLNIKNKKTKAEIISLINIIISNNVTNSNTKIKVEYKIEEYASKTTPAETVNDLNNLLQIVANSELSGFSVQLKEYDDYGHISKIKIWGQ